MNLSKNFSLEEFLKSATATKYKIDNKPNDNIIKNLQDLVCNCLQPIRDNFNKPVIISSGFRCKQLNDKVGGARNSQHLTGQAADFIIKDLDFDTVIQWCIDNLEFDQLIDEYAKRTHWLHISFNKLHNRKEVLIYRNGSYKLWKKNS